MARRPSPMQAAGQLVAWMVCTRGVPQCPPGGSPGGRGGLPAGRGCNLPGAERPAYGPAAAFGAAVQSAVPAATAGSKQLPGRAGGGAAWQLVRGARRGWLGHDSGAGTGGWGGGSGRNFGTLFLVASCTTVCLYTGKPGAQPTHTTDRSLKHNTECAAAKMCVPLSQPLPSPCWHC